MEEKIIYKKEGYYLVEEGTNKILKGPYKKYSEVLDVASIVCECLKCGATKNTEGHCIDEKCPKCGSQMRRKNRPGIGR